MVAVWLVILSAPDIARIDHMAQHRDVPGLSALLASGSGNPLRTIQASGAYGVGSKGWHAIEAKAPGSDDRFVVLTTPLTTEDIGELVFRRTGDRLEYIPESDDLGMRILRHRFDVRYRVARKVAEITDQILLRRTHGGGAFFFRMSPNYRVASIRDRSGKTVAFAQAGGTVVMDRPTKERTVYRVEYSAIVDQPGFAGSIGPTEASVTNDYWYPSIARLPAPYEVTVHPPAGWTVIGQGVQTPPRGAVRYRMDLPVTYYSLSVGRYRTATKTIGKRTYRAWSPRLSAPELEVQTELMASVVDFYDKTFGPWPFNGYGALDSPSYGGGALEAYSYATYGDGLPQEDAHEPSHTIFGGVLGNDYLRSFWNESFAAFCEGFYGREVSIGNPDERRLAFIRVANPDPSFSEGACATTGAEDGGLASSLGYGKGALVLQMLEQMIGTPRLVAAVRQWRSMHAPGTLTGWEDFEKAVRSVAPEMPIKRFFDAWIRGSKVPTIDLLGAIRTSTGVRVSLAVSPTGYVFPMDVLLLDGNGARRLCKVLVDATTAKTDVGVPAPAGTARVSLDPWRRILRTMSSDEDVPTLGDSLTAMRIVRDPVHKTYLPTFREGSNGGEPFLIGHPDSMPAMRVLCRQVGFAVNGHSLTYRGTTIDLRRGGAIALVDLPDGKRGAIGLGTALVAPNLGQARLVVFDRLGRFLRGDTQPKTTGALTASVE